MGDRIFAGYILLVIVIFIILVQDKELSKTGFSLIMGSCFISAIIFLLCYLPYVLIVGHW